MAGAGKCPPYFLLLNRMNIYTKIVVLVIVFSGLTIVLDGMSWGDDFDIASTFGHCIDVHQERVFGLGVSADENQQKHWVAFEGDKIIDLTPDEGTLGKQVTQSYCWMDDAKQMHLVWARHGTSPGDGVTKSDILYHRIYDFEENRWQNPEVIWRAPEGVVFNWEDDKTSFARHEAGTTYIAFEISDYRIGVVSLQPGDDAWAFRSIDAVNYKDAAGDSHAYRLTGFPGIHVAPDNSMHLAYMTSYEQSDGSEITYDVYVITSEDAWASWSNPVLVAQTESKVLMRPSVWQADGLLHVLWYEKTVDEKLRRFGYRYSADEGHTWSNTQLVDLAAPHGLWKRMCEDAMGRRHLVIGNLFARPVAHYVKADSVWQHVVDVDAFFPESEYVGLLEPALACSGNQLYLYMQGIGKSEELDISDQQYPTERVLIRLDTLGVY